MASSLGFIRNYIQSSLASMVLGAIVALVFGSFYAKLDVLPDLGLESGKQVVLWQLVVAMASLGLFLAIVGELLKWSWSTTLVYIGCGPWWILALHACLGYGVLSGLAWLSLPILHSLVDTITVKYVLRKS